MLSSNVYLERCYLQGCVGTCACGQTMLYLHPNVTQKPTREKWTTRENVFFSGIALAHYSFRHSFKSKNEEENQHVWKNIKRCYDLACKRYYILTGEATGARSLEAMMKHWKETAQILPGNTYSCYSQAKLWEMEFNKDYNVGFILTCSDEEFNHAVNQARNTYNQCKCYLW